MPLRLCRQVRSLTRFLHRNSPTRRNLVFRNIRSFHIIWYGSTNHYSISFVVVKWICCLRLMALWGSSVEKFLVMKPDLLPCRPLFITYGSGRGDRSWILTGACSHMDLQENPIARFDNDKQHIEGMATCQAWLCCVSELSYTSELDCSRFVKTLQIYRKAVTL